MDSDFLSTYQRYAHRLENYDLDCSLSHYLVTYVDPLHVGIICNFDGLLCNLGLFITDGNSFL